MKIFTSLLNRSANNSDGAIRFAGSSRGGAPFRQRRTLFGSAGHAGLVESGRRLFRAKPVAALAILLACCLLAGCVSPETAAYRTLGTTVTIVDGAMNGWGDWVRAGRPSASEQEAVRHAYERYQAAMRIARNAVVAAKTAPDGSTARETALRAVEASQAGLVNLINLLAK